MKERRKSKYVAPSCREFHINVVDTILANGSVKLPPGAGNGGTFNGSNGEEEAGGIWDNFKK